MRSTPIRSIVATAVAAATALALTLGGASVAAAASAPAPAAVQAAVAQLTHAEATSRLQSSGITWRSSGNCSDRNNATCTSFDGVNLASIQGAQTLKSASGCALTITGGTETGHASGTYSHATATSSISRSPAA